jgi:hypothetical protein
MARGFFILVVVVFLGQATGVIAFMAEIACTEDCSDELLPRQCAPLCMCYTCGMHHRPLTTVAQVAWRGQPFLYYMPLQRTSAPTSLPAFKIFHVPKRVLA